jgi:hypothetical protein
MTTKEEQAADAEVMRRHIASYKTSGLSVKEYCKANNLSIHRFNYRYYGPRKRRISRKHKGFSQVKPMDSQVPASIDLSRHPTVEVTLANGNRVAFFESNSLDLFKALL